MIVFLQFLYPLTWYEFLWIYFPLLVMNKWKSIIICRAGNRILFVCKFYLLKQQPSESSIFKDGKVSRTKFLNLLTLSVKLMKP